MKNILSNILFFCFGIFAVQTVYAENCAYNPPQVSLQLTAETWVSTKRLKSPSLGTPL